jgi:serine/threonine protein kinase
MMKNSYRYINMIGKGGFGKVWKVKHLGCGKLFALKEMSKAT